MIKKLLLGAVAVTVAGLVTPAAAQQNIVIGASSVGGSYYLYSGGVATLVNRNTDDLVATARTTRGSVENVRLLHAGRIEFAFSGADSVYQIRTGLPPFKGAASTKIRGIARIDAAPMHMVTMADSGIKKFKDLAGKKVSVGAAGSGTAAMGELVLKAYNMMDSVKIQKLGFEESASNMRDGNLDAFNGASALPMPAVADLSTLHKIRILEISDQAIAKVGKQNPAIGKFVIPGGTYKGVDKDVVTIAAASTFVTRADMDEDAVYRLTKLFMTGKSKKYMQSVYRAWNPTPGEDLFKSMGVPMHPGAVRAYKELGLMQ